MKLSNSSNSFLLAGIAGFFMPYLTGFLGLMPLDQSIIFEAGGRIGRGDVPFDDFHFPYGLVPALMQALFFKVLGVNWIVYVTHAAVINAFFAFIFFDCLRILLPQASEKNRVFATLLASWAFYPMMGTPFMENHSLFFSLTAWWICLIALSRGKYYLLFFVFPLLVLGFYSKPLPVVFWLVAVLPELWFRKKEWKQWLRWMLYGMFAGFLLLALPAMLFPSKSFFYYSFLLPLQLGKTRAGGEGAGSFVEKINQCKLLLLSLVPLLFFIFRKGKRWPAERENFLRVVFIVIITIIPGFLSLNDFYNVTTPVFVLAFFVFDRMMYLSGRQIPYRYVSPLLWIGLLAGITYLNFTRKIHDMNFTFNDLSHYSPDVGLFVKSPAYYNYSTDDIRRIKEYISKGNTVYVGDLMFLYSLTGKKDPWPVTHIHDGTTYNSTDTAHYNSLKKQLLQNMNDMKANVLIRDSTWWINESFVYFVDQFKGKKRDSFGTVAVYDMDVAKFYKAAKTLNMNFEK